MSETKKIGIACFTGGVLFSIVALLFTPAYWGLGFIAGIAGGYVTYEFREFCGAVAITLREAGNGLGAEFERFLKSVGEFFAQAHPFGYPAIALNLSFVIWGYGFTASGRRALGWVFASPGNFFTLLFFGGILFCFVSAFLVAILMLFAIHGAVDEKCAWTRDPAKVSREDRNGWRKVMFSYPSAYRWLAKGIGDFIIFVLWEFWKSIAIGIYIAVKFVGQFLWFLFKLIHSEKRLLCGADGTLGGFVSYLWRSTYKPLFRWDTPRNKDSSKYPRRRGGGKEGSETAV